MLLCYIVRGSRYGSRLESCKGYQTVRDIKRAKLLLSVCDYGSKSLFGEFLFYGISCNDFVQECEEYILVLCIELVSDFLFFYFVQNCRYFGHFIFGDGLVCLL